MISFPSNRSLKRRFLASLATIALATSACLSACSSDDDVQPNTPDSSVTETGGTLDAASDGPVGDAPVEDASKDTSDAGADVVSDALPPLCQTYVDSVIGDAGKRWRVIADNSVNTARGSCEIGAHYTEFNTVNPYQDDCFYEELREAAGCKNQGGIVYNYDLALDRTGKPCNPPAMTDPRVRLSFRNPKLGGIRPEDVDFLVSIVKARATAAGLAPADAARLEQILLQRKAEAVGDGGAGYSRSKCDGG